MSAMLRYQAKSLHFCLKLAKLEVFFLKTKNCQDNLKDRQETSKVKLFGPTGRLPPAKTKAYVILPRSLFVDARKCCSFLRIFPSNSGIVRKM